MNLHIFTNDEEYVIAETAEEAAEIYAKSIGYETAAAYHADVGECPWHLNAEKVAFSAGFSRWRYGKQGQKTGAGGG